MKHRKGEHIKQPSLNQKRLNQGLTDKTKLTTINECILKGELKTRALEEW